MAARRGKQTDTETLLVGDLAVQLTRKSVRNINMRIRRDGTVAISAPRNVPTERIAAFVASKRGWIARAQDRLAKADQARESHVEEGSVIRLWGKPLTCRIESSPANRNESVCVCGDELILALPPSRARDADDAKTGTHVAYDTVLKAWLDKQVKAAAAGLLPTCEELVGTRASLLRFRRMTSRWGSCNVKTAAITLNTELVHYPPECLRYVIIHELCHLYEPSHNARFHSLMDRFCPTWHEQRAQLAHRQV